VIIVGDIGSCTMGKWEYIQEAIDVAKEAGLDIIKFQLFKGNDNGNIEFPRHLWFQTVDYARSKDVDIFASVFDEEAIDLIVASGIKKIKLAYSQNFNLKLIKKAKKHGLEIWASGDYENYPNYAEVKLLCVPKYPTKELGGYEVILKNFYGSAEHFNGISIHKLWPFIERTDIMEVHFTLDHDDIDCPDHWFALSPKELKELCNEKTN
jgi:sialic acid synthase SpsE